MNAGSVSELEESPPACGGRSKPPVVLSFSHFVAGCCANVFYDCAPPPSTPLRLWPIITFIFFTALLLGGKLSVFLYFFFITNSHPREERIS